jgi:hypothetical protein
LSQKYTNSQENYPIVIDTSSAAPDVAVRNARDGMGLALRKTIPRNDTFGQSACGLLDLGTPGARGAGPTITGEL